MTSSTRRKSALVPITALLGAALLTGCGSNETAFPRSADQRGGATSEAREGTLGSDGLVLLGEGGLINAGSSAKGPRSGIGVNALLWRASLDAISFMPLASADPFGGVIITDWHSPPHVDNERLKIHLYILGRDLRADGIRAAVFRQRDNGKGQWVNAEVDEQTAVELENAILTRARQFRIAGLD